MKKIFTHDVIILLVGCVIILFLIHVTGVNAATVSCLSNEPREYSFDIKDQVKGEYFQIIEFETGPKAGMVYTIKIKDVSNPSESEDWIKKACLTCPVKNKIIYSLSCSKPLK